MPADPSSVLEEERPPRDAADVGRGLDALDTPTEQRTPFWRRAVRGIVPPIVAVVLFIVLWQVLWASAIWPEFKLPSPEAVFDTIGNDFADGRALSIIWTS